MERGNSCSFHRTTDWLSLGGAFGGDLIQPLAQAGTHRTNTHDLLQMPFEYLHKRDPTTSLGTLCHCSVTLTVRKCCLMFRVNSLCFIFFPLPLVPSLGSTEKSLAVSLLHSPIWWMGFLWAFSSPGWTVPALLAFSCRRAAAVIFVALCWTTSSMFMCLLYWGAQN